MHGESTPHNTTAPRCARHRLNSPPAGHGRSGYQGVITPISKQIKCISQDFGNPSILLVASSGGASWWYVVVTPRRVNDRITFRDSLMVGRRRVEPSIAVSGEGDVEPWHFVPPSLFEPPKPLHLRSGQTSARPCFLATKSDAVHHSVLAAPRPSHPHMTSSSTNYPVRVSALTDAEGVSQYPSA